MSDQHRVELSQQALNKAMLEAVDFVHAEGWDASPTLFALVPTRLIAQSVDTFEQDDSPLTLVVQEELPTHILPGSMELGDYLSRITWPEEVLGAVLAQEIKFRDSSDEESDAPRPARLLSGVLRNGAHQTLFQMRPSAEELATKGPFAEDDIELRGGGSIAPGVIATLLAGFDD
ncbi:MULTISPECIES: PPA1309 family protein [unclassified Corynebacterium]|uniref:PPA1309 family protein n=1 Tax=unclassified Corynebacterium TaxID=2624378 RepID=UPI0021679353|nr:MULTISPECIES: PPA1309 family protein [unclassified Corynebacterium]MCS4489451.1 PPA1309 family protein [Corynebacterium sp. ES2775-CONJ]MCS4491538.1 PPA1309 family protein [Corynebacterium sp. ES2715-CONJ3]